MALKTCMNCGGLYTTKPGEMFAGTPCRCVCPSSNDCPSMNWQPISRNWQPISSAPKDGTKVLIANEVGDMDVAGYIEEWNETKEFVRNAKDGDVYRTVREEVGYWDTAKAYCPTHWMPLPPPPSVEDGERG